VLGKGQGLDFLSLIPNPSPKEKGTKIPWIATDLQIKELLGRKLTRIARIKPGGFKYW
jgi:hypothetical protein